MFDVYANEVLNERLSAMRQCVVPFDRSVRYDGSALKLLTMWPTLFEQLVERVGLLRSLCYVERSSACVSS